MEKKVLSVFIDESGDFGAYSHHSPYYIVSMVLHDQAVDIQSEITGLNERLLQSGYQNHVIHTGPLIRREQDYKNELTEKRRHLFNMLYYFCRKIDFHYISISIRKRECADVIALTAKISRQISSVLMQHRDYFANFEKIIVYYDNGQIELTKILTSVFNALFTHVEFRKVLPSEYKLCQVADLICTMQLLSEKSETDGFTASEMEFFSSPRDFRKNYLKNIRKKQL